jgi:hypothetical protein
MEQYMPCDKKSVLFSSYGSSRHHDGRIIKDLKQVTYFPVSHKGNFVVVLSIGRVVCLFTSYKYGHSAL